MRIILLSLWILTASTSTWGALDPDQKEKFLEKYFAYRIDGRDAKAIDLALTEFKKHDLELERYIVLVKKDEDKITVMFWSPRRLNEPILGPIKGISELNVEIDQATLQIIGSSFSR